MKDPNDMTSEPETAPNADPTDDAANSPASDVPSTEIPVQDQSRTTRVIGRPFEKGNKPLAPWKPGQSGNPLGRPKEVWTADDMRRRLRRQGPAALSMVKRAIAEGLASDDPKVMAIGLKAAQSAMELGFDLGTTKNVNMAVTQAPSFEGWTEGHFALYGALLADVAEKLPETAVAGIVERILARLGERTVEAVRIPDEEQKK